MTKTIDTLVPDLYELLQKGFVGSEEWTSRLGHVLANETATRFDAEDRVGPGYIRPSILGDKCDRKLWYAVHQHEEKAAFDGPALLKFFYGNVLEEVLLSMAEAAGHDVQARQAEATLYGVTGHIDAIVDGELVDVKSASSIAFDKFKDHLTPDKDSFGYLSQIGFYLEAMQNEPLLVNKDEAAFLVVDKTLGKLCLDRHSRAALKRDWSRIIQAKETAISRETPPSRAYLPEADGKSGNLKLGTQCAYCSFHTLCWPGLRTFLYSNGPRYLTHTARTPDVPEVSE